MKANLIKPLVLGGVALAIGASFSSCVDPYTYGTAPRPATQTYSAGYEVRTLPPGYRTETISGTRYYTSNGVYYRPRADRYVVVEVPRQRYRDPEVVREVYVDRLPRGYRVEDRSGRRYYRVRDTYYERSGDRYVVVRRPY